MFHQLAGLRMFDCHEVSLNYDASDHGGDRRKTSQPCGLASLSRFHTDIRAVRHGADLW